VTDARSDGISEREPRSGATPWRRRGVLSSVAVLAVLASVAPSADGRRTEGGTPPSIVVVMTDDQRWDSTWAMPMVQRWMVEDGVTFSQAFVVNPLCCPSRTSILTGQLSHTTGIYGNSPPHGSFLEFDDSSTIATWLHAAGYRTALVGKYLNKYEESEAAYIPPGWDRWVAFVSEEGNGGYFDYALSMDGTIITYGSAEPDYSTDVLAEEAETFIRSTPANEPLFLMFDPKAPHDPAIPAPRHADEFGDLPPARPPSFNEADVSDKPTYIQQVDRLNHSEVVALDEFRRNQYRSLLAVDDALFGIVDALKDTGRLDTTMIVFLSDNGRMHGEHRGLGKSTPYEESIRVPLIVRYPPLVEAGTIDHHLVLNVDLAPTFAELAGVPAPGVEGMSLLPLMQPPVLPWRRDLLVEHLATEGRVPTYCAVRTGSYKYLRYETDEEELYDLGRDPYELENRSDSNDYASILRSMRGRLLQLCDPPPPGFDPRP
jgi:N-acetylglucosamine-6-sulfatase